MQLMNNRERGDTLIEVLVAITAFAVVVVGAFSLMNRGVSQMYDSMERSEVRMLLNSQVDALTYARDEYIRSLQPSQTDTRTASDAAALAVWNTIKTLPQASGIPSLQECTDATNAFWVDTSSLLALQTKSATPSFKALSSGFPSLGNGIWIQKIDYLAGVAKVPYKDFYIRACWTPTSSSTTQVLSTIVRLYDQ